MLVGLKILFVIAIMGGIIAYMGDKLGTKIGKRRISLFGIRPKHTSILVTIVTGLLVAATTVGVLTITSQSVRTALFGMDQLRAEMNSLNEEVAKKTQELVDGQAKLDASKKELAERTSELDVVKADVVASREEMEEARAARDAMGQELVSVQDAYKESASKLVDLQAARKVMEAHIGDLQVTQKELEFGLTHLREGTIIFRVDELLSQALVRPGLTEEESRLAISNILNDTNGLILRKLGLEESQSVIYVSRTNIDEATKTITNAKEPMVVQVIAAGNVIVGEPAVAEIHVYPQQLIYKNEAVIDSIIIQGGGNGRYNMINFLREVNAKAKAKGVIPDTLTGDVGNISSDELVAIIKRIDSTLGKVRVEAIAAGDTYSSGPVQIHLRVTDVSEFTVE